MGFEELGKKLARLGQDTRSGVQKMSESYQTNSKLNEEKKVLERLYISIGTKYYKANEENPPEELVEEFEAVKVALQKIEEFNEQINKAKGVAHCPECGKPAAKGENFCSACGTKLPEMEDISAKVKQDAMEAAGEAGAIMGDAAQKAMGFVGSMADKADAFVKGMTAAKRTGQSEPVDVEDYTVTDAEASEDAAAEETVQDAAQPEGVEDETVTEDAAVEDGVESVPTEETASEVEETLETEAAETAEAAEETAEAEEPVETTGETAEVETGEPAAEEEE